MNVISGKESERGEARMLTWQFDIINKEPGPLMSRGMKGMMGGSSLATVSRYARWFLDGSCGNTGEHRQQPLPFQRSRQRLCAVRAAPTCHQVLKLPVKLPELAGKFLWAGQLKAELGFTHESLFQTSVPRLTSQVMFNLHTAGLLSPIVTAKKPFRFL